MSGRGGLAITGYSLCNALGRTTAEVIESLSASKSGLGPTPCRLPFETVCGAVRGELPAPPPEAPIATDSPMLALLHRVTEARVSVDERPQSGVLTPCGG